MEIITAQLDKIAIGLNIEGVNPSRFLPEGADWFNLILAVDEPMTGLTFDLVMDKVKTNNFKLIEESIDEFDVDTYINLLVKICLQLKQKYKKVLIHVHQYEGTTILHKILEKETGIKAILDGTNFFLNSCDYKKDYPDVDCLFSISQCASLSEKVKAGTLIVGENFYPFDPVKNQISLKAAKAKNRIEDYLVNVKYIKGNILVVNDLWNPTDLNLKISLLD